MIAVEVKGLGMPPHGTMQWSPTQVEVTAMTTALQALLETSLVDSDVIVSRTPVPPYLSVTWFTELDGALVSGLYYGNLQPLPDPLDRVIRTILPGGLCDKALN